MTLGTIESYRRSMHTDFFWRYRAIKDIAQITSYRDAIGAPCIRALFRGLHRPLFKTCAAHITDHVSAADHQCPCSSAVPNSMKGVRYVIFKSITVLLVYIEHKTYA